MLKALSSASNILEKIPNFSMGNVNTIVSQIWRFINEIAIGDTIYAIQNYQGLKTSSNP
mgnify:FL=1